MISQLLRWYDANKRDLPWRRSPDAYSVWISEAMLQQTQVATVMPYFVRWMERFPNVGSLAKADVQDVLALWQGLGYYRRGRMVHEGARWMAEHGMPTRSEEWLKVPGVGRYTAAAIASIAHNEPVPVVDGNVERVFARLTACREPRPALTDLAWRWAGEHLDSSRPGDWNQALMELGATVCKPKLPLCNECPLAGQCVARSRGIVGEVPVPKVRPQTVQLEHVVWVPWTGTHLGLSRIPAGQWWHGMWEFPRWARGDAPNLRGVPEPLGSLQHSVTHHRIRIEAALLRCEPTSYLCWFVPQELETLPMPAPQRKILRLALARI
jgi:A/G-specific adenine glycosylase